MTSDPFQPARAIPAGERALPRGRRRRLPQEGRGLRPLRPRRLRLTQAEGRGGAVARRPREQPAPPGGVEGRPQAVQGALRQRQGEEAGRGAERPGRHPAGVGDHQCAGAAGMFTYSRENTEIMSGI